MINQVKHFLRRFSTRADTQTPAPLNDPKADSVPSFLQELHQTDNQDTTEQGNTYTSSPPSAEHNGQPIEVYTLSQLPQALQTQQIAPEHLVSIPRNIRVLPILNTADELLAQYIEQHRSTDQTVAYLMTLADRLTCTTEMATLLAILSVGGPQRLLYKDPHWDAATHHAVQRIHTTLAQGCRDDIELALKLYVAWSQVHYEQQSLVSPRILARTWYPRRLPGFSTEMRKLLDTRATQFIQDVVQATEFAHILQFVDSYGLQEVAETWLAEAQKVFLQAQQEAWANAYFIQHALLRTMVEPERERLLSDLEVNKKEVERRPINFDLLERVRLLFAYFSCCLTTPASDITELPCNIYLEPEWQRWLQQTERSTIALARFITQKTRHNTYKGDLISHATYQRLFLDLRVPLGSRYICSVSHIGANGIILVQLQQCMAEAPYIQEGFSIISGGNNISSSHIPRDTTHQEPLEGVQQQWMGITGQLRTTVATYHIGDTLQVEVSGYTFTDPTHPCVLVTLVPELQPFEIFSRQYQIGDVIDVTVQGYTEYTETCVALIVQERVSQLELLLEPEQLSFLEIGPAIKDISLGTTLTMLIDDIDEVYGTVALSSLPLMEVHLNKMLQGHKQEDGTYALEASIDAIVHDSLYMHLPWHEPAHGFIYAVQVASNSLPATQTSYRVGDTALLHLSFPDYVTSQVLHSLPLEVRQMLDVFQGQPPLMWKQERFHFHGRMAYGKCIQFLALSNEPAYQQAIRRLYRLSHQFIVTVVEIKHTFPPLVESLEKASAMQETATQNVPEDLVEAIFEEYSTGGAPPNQEAPLSSIHTLASYHAGDRVTGRVTGIQEYGAFVEIELGIYGMVHKSKMWGYVVDAHEVVQLDQDIEVLVLQVNTEDNNLELSMLIPEYNPLLQYQEDDIITGTVTDVQDFGAFVDIAPGVSGLVHKTKMWGFVQDARDIIHVGAQVTVCVLSTNLEKNGLELSMLVPEHDPLEYYQPGDIEFGTVTDVKYYGAFVEIEPGASGLVYKHDIRAGVTDARRELRVGDRVQVLIVRINKEKRHLSLSIKDV